MQTRRQFVARAGGAAATVLVPTVARHARWPRPSRSAAAASPTASSSGDPTPKGDHPVDALRPVGRRRAPARSSSRSRPTSPSATSSRARTSRRAPRPTTRSRRASAGLKAHEQYYYRFSSKSADSPVGRFRTALPADSKQPVQVRVLLLPGLHARLLQRATTLMADGDYDFVVCLGRLHLRRGLPLGQAGGTRRARRQDRHARTPATRTSSARPSRSPTTAPSTRSTAPTRCCARSTRSSRW